MNKEYEILKVEKKKMLEIMSRKPKLVICPKQKLQLQLSYSFLFIGALCCIYIIVKEVFLK